MQRTRPVGVIIIGVLNLLAGLSSFICAPLNLFGLFFGRDDPGVAFIHSQPVLFGWSVLSSVVGIVLGLVLVAASIGLFMLKPWARLATIGWAILALVLAIIGFGLNIVFQVAPTMSGGQDTAYRAGYVFGLMLAGCISLIYPAIVAVVLTRPSIVDAFDPLPYVSPGGDPGYSRPA